MEPLSPPHWDLSNVYPGLDSAELAADWAALNAAIAAFQEFAVNRLWPATADDNVGTLGALLGEGVDRLNHILLTARTIQSYLFSYVSTDSRNALAARKLSEYEQAAAQTAQLVMRFQSWVGRIEGVLPAAVVSDSRAQAHRFMLEEAAREARYLMSEPEEALAAELTLSGANAWSKLQGKLTSQLSVPFAVDGTVKDLPMPALINLRTHVDEGVRRRAYEAELAAWEKVREPLAACLNGVKGEVVTLNRRRGRCDAVHSAIAQSRIDRATLEAMLSAMEASLPSFRRYFRAKARRLGKEQLAWWDLYAPAGRMDRTYTYAEACGFLLENFDRFSSDLSALTRRAFAGQWIDAEPRDGKRAGGFCMDIPKVRESRIMFNFDGTLDGISTLAHELGHAFHADCLYRAGKTMLQASTPMTMAETASIMCEAVVMNAVLALAADPQEQLAILEIELINSSQVIVDIYSRYLFEREVFERRAAAELAADELCEIMACAQKASYGDGLDERFLHPYMWTWKPHYYAADLSFYNFPYAFGRLFATGLYAVYQQRGPAFVSDYQKLLAATGEANAADLADRFGIDLRTQEFWDNSLAIIGRQIDRYCLL